MSTDEFRGQGVGERLLQARGGAVTRERGGCYIRLAVDTENCRAQAFYTRARYQAFRHRADPRRL